MNSGLSDLRKIYYFNNEPFGMNLAYIFHSEVDSSKNEREGDRLKGFRGVSESG